MTKANVWGNIELEWLENNRELVESENLVEIFKALDKSPDLSRWSADLLRVAIIFMVEGPSGLKWEVYKSTPNILKLEFRSSHIMYAVGIFPTNPKLIQIVRLPILFFNAAISTDITDLREMAERAMKLTWPSQGIVNFLISIFDKCEKTFKEDKT